MAQVVRVKALPPTWTVTAAQDGYAPLLGREAGVSAVDSRLFGYEDCAARVLTILSNTDFRRSYNSRRSMPRSR